MQDLRGSARLCTFHKVMAAIVLWHLFVVVVVVVAAAAVVLDYIRTCADGTYSFIGQACDCSCVLRSKVGSVSSSEVNMLPV